MKAERREERERRTVTNYSEVLYVLNTDLNHVFLRGGEYLLFFFFIFYFSLWRCDPTRVMVSSFLMFLDHAKRRSTVGRTPLDEWSARRRDLYLTTHDTHNRQNIHAPGGIRSNDLSRRAAPDLRLRRRGYWNRRIFFIPTVIKLISWHAAPELVPYTSPDLEATFRELRFKSVFK
jgi:hypothetical protein